jgi:uncharacterized membrane protein YhaH (DUF805 family)
MDYAWFLFRLDGRINRAKCWLAVLIIVCWMMFLAALIIAVGGLFGGPTSSFSFGVNDLFRIVDPAAYRSLTPAGLVAVVVKATGTALFAWVYLATSVKRLHDRDKSGWWMVPFFVVPGLYNEFADRLDNTFVTMPFELIAFVLCIWGFVEMYCLKGSRKTNRFGPNPLLRADTRPRWEQHREVELVPHKAGPPPVWRVKPGHD